MIITLPLALTLTGERTMNTRPRARLPSLGGLSLGARARGAPTAMPLTPQAPSVRTGEPLTLIGLVTGNEGDAVLQTILEVGFFNLEEDGFFPTSSRHPRRRRLRAADLLEARDHLVAFRSVSKTFREFADKSTSVSLQLDENGGLKFVETGLWPRVFDAVLKQSGCDESELEELRKTIDEVCRTEHPYDNQQAWHIKSNVHPAMAQTSTPTTHPQHWQYGPYTDAQRMRHVAKSSVDHDSGFWSHAPRVVELQPEQINEETTQAQNAFRIRAREAHDQLLAESETSPPPFNETQVAFEFKQAMDNADMPAGRDYERLLLFLFCVYTQMYIPLGGALYSDDELFGRDWERWQFDNDYGDDNGLVYDVEYPCLESSPYCGRLMPHDRLLATKFVENLWKEAHDKNAEIISERRSEEGSPYEWLTADELDWEGRA